MELARTKNRIKAAMSKLMETAYLEAIPQIQAETGVKVNEINVHRTNARTGAIELIVQDRAYNVNALAGTLNRV